MTLALEPSPSVLLPAVVRTCRALPFRPVHIAAAMAAALLGVTASPVHAAGVSLAAGPTWTIGQRSSGAIFLTLTGAERRWGGLHWQPELDLGGIKNRHVPSRHLDRNVAVAAAGVRLPHLWRQAFFSFQVGAASPHTGALSSTLQFVSSLGWQQGHAMVMLRHISNGSTHEPNYGESMVLVGVAF